MRPVSGFKPALAKRWLRKAQKEFARAGGHVTPSEMKQMSVEEFAWVCEANHLSLLAAQPGTLRDKVVQVLKSDKEGIPCQ